MDRGTYAAASGGILQLRKLEAVNNNLANVNTPGFKRQMMIGDVQTFDQTLASLEKVNDPYAKGDHDRTPGTSGVRMATDFSLGAIQETSNPLDVALRNPNDFLVVNTPDGQRYTRAGNLSLSSAGELVTADGFQVMGDGGPITANGPGVTITDSGSVRAGGTEIGRLQVVRIENPGQMEREGGTRFKLPPGQAATPVDADLVSGALEMSNVSPITSVIDLITANRGFDLYTKSANTIDQMNQTAIQQVGKRSF